jgi:hypothetical protein
MGAVELVGLRLPDGERAVFIVPAIRDDWPPALKDAVAIRRRATIEGTCPRCGASWRLPNRDERRRAVRERRVIHLWMAHEPDCPAGDERLLALAREAGAG